MTMELASRAPATARGVPDPALAIVPSTPDGDHGPTSGVTGTLGSDTGGGMGDAPDGAPGAPLATLPTADERLIGLWLHGKAPLTQRLYRRHNSLSPRSSEGRSPRSRSMTSRPSRRPSLPGHRQRAR